MIPSTPSLHAAGPLAVGALVLALAGCGSTDGGSADGDANADELPTFAAEEVLRLGSVADPDSGFARPLRMDVDHEGNIYVLDAQDLMIRVFNPEGKILRWIGRRGQGPGEFESSPAFGVQGDTVWAADGFRVVRLTLFDREGDVLSTARADALMIGLHPGSTWGVLTPREMGPDGRFLADMTGRAGGSSYGDAPENFAATDTIPVPRLVYDAATGEIADTIGFWPYPPPEPYDPPDQVTIGGTSYRLPSPPSDGPIVERLFDGMITVDRAASASGADTTFRVIRTDLAGDTVWSHELRYTPRPYEEEDIARQVWDRVQMPTASYRLVNGMPQIPPMPDDSMRIFNQLRPKLEFPDFQPPVRGRHLGDDGRIWLERGDQPGDAVPWIVLDPDGTPVGTVTLPADRRILWSGGDTFFLSEEDELGVPWVVKYRMTEGAGS